MAIQCATCGGPLGDINAACPVCLPGFGLVARRPLAVDVSRVADARERAVRDILAMSFWSEYMQDDVVYTSQIRDYLQELERLR